MEAMPIENSKNESDIYANRSHNRSTETPIYVPMVAKDQT